MKEENGSEEELSRMCPNSECDVDILGSCWY